MNLKAKLHKQVTEEDAKYYHLSAEQIPGGQGYHKPNITFPHSVIKVEDKGDLNKLLDHYGHHVNWKDLVPDSKFARRWWVERMRPTLRFYCKKYQVSIPGWLQNDDYFTEMDSSTKHKLFGPEPLRPISFKKFETKPLHSHEDEQQE